MKNGKLRNFKNWLQKLSEPPGRIESGVYQYRREGNGILSRFHLRVEEDGSGMLLANSSVAARLTASGVMIARLLLENKSEQEIHSVIKHNFRKVNDRQLASDIEKLRGFIGNLASPESGFPVFNLDDPAIGPPPNLFAPIHCQIPVAETDQIRPLLHKLWGAGIPHVTFAMQESQAGDHVVLNVEAAEDIGMICGVRATGSWLKIPELRQKLAMAGVDYIMLPVVSADAAEHDRYFGASDLENALSCFDECRRLEVCPVAEVAITPFNLNGLESIIDMLEGRGIRNVQYFAVAGSNDGALTGPEIIEAAVRVDELASRSLVQYVWLPAVSRSLSLQQTLLLGPRAAGDVSMHLDLDGSVHPPRGDAVPAGNILTEKWNVIWKREPFAKFRLRVESPTHCEICPILEICAADCPAEPAGWDRQ